MSQKIRQARAKRERNAEYARQFPTRDRVARKKARRQRTVARELRWLERHSVELFPRQRAA